MCFWVSQVLLHDHHIQKRFLPYMVWWINNHKHSIMIVSIFLVISSVYAFWEFLRLGNSTCDFMLNQLHLPYTRRTLINGYTEMIHLLSLPQMSITSEIQFTKNARLLFLTALSSRLCWAYSLRSGFESLLRPESFRPFSLLVKQG